MTPELYKLLTGIEGDLMGYVERLRKEGARMSISYAVARDRLEKLRAELAKFEERQSHSSPSISSR